MVGFELVSVVPPFLSVSRVAGRAPIGAMDRQVRVWHFFVLARFTFECDFPWTPSHWGRLDRATAPCPLDAESSSKAPIERACYSLVFVFFRFVMVCVGVCCSAVGVEPLLPVLLVPSGGPSSRATSLAFFNICAVHMNSKRHMTVCIFRRPCKFC